MICTGLAMSPAVTSVVPVVVDRVRRPAERADDSFLRGVRAHGLRAAARRAGVAVRLHRPHAGDDHRPARPGRPVHEGRRHERETLPPADDHDRPRRGGRRRRLACHDARDGSLRADPGELPRRLRPERDAHLCRPTAAHQTAVDGARVRSQPDFDGDSCQRRGAEVGAVSDACWRASSPTGA